MPNAPRKNVTTKAKALLRSSGAKTVRSVADEVIGAAVTAGAAVVVSKIADALKPLTGEGSTPAPAPRVAAPRGEPKRGATAKKSSKKSAKKSTKKSPAAKRSKAETGGRRAKKK